MGCPDTSVSPPEFRSTSFVGHTQPEVYLIDRGFRRYIPNVTTYENLFRDWECIIEDIDIETIRLGDPLSDGASLVRVTGREEVYFVDEGIRRLIPCAQVLDK